MEFLGITGVEDKLQEDVNPTIESLREAGINVWMLTGDKVETAICIAISAGFKSAKQEMFVMRDITDPIEIQNQLSIFNNKLNCVLIIDGATLHSAMEYHKKYFFDVAGKAPAVVCCRCSPTQKADVTNCIKEFTGKKTCAIGDGGNDVGMIQASDVGVGIVGKEGKQAALAADFSIMKFKYVKTLMLWHGRNAYKRTAVMSQFVIHRGLIISLIQQLFSLIFYYVDMQYYNGYLMLGYATAFTSFPIFCIVLDHDVTKNVALTYSPLYKSLQKGRELNNRTFCFWVWKSIYQAAIITLLPVALFPESLREYTTLTYTALIINELLNVLSEVNKMSWAMFIVEILTAASYFGSLILWPLEFDVSPFVEKLFWRLALLNLLSWLPLHVAKMIWHKWDPSDNQKIMRRAKVMEQIAEQENKSNQDSKIKIISIFNKIGDKVVPFRKKEGAPKKNEVPHQKLVEEEEIML
jgi:phospholipid-translocating ATPase